MGQLLYVDLMWKGGRGLCSRKVHGKMEGDILFKNYSWNNGHT